MKKLLYSFAIFILFISASVQGQCLEAENGLYPEETFQPECTGTSEVIDDFAYSSEYSNVQVTSGQTYTFSSNIPTDFLTISNEGGTTAFTSGVQSVAWVSTLTGVVRFYTHEDAACTGTDEPRSRIIFCGTAPTCDNPIVSLPYSTGFEDFEANACLTIEDVNGGIDSGWAVTNDFPTQTGDRSIVYTYDSDLPGDDWFFTPGLNLVAGSSYTLSFVYRGGLGVFDFLENLEVKYGLAASAAAMTTSLYVDEDIDTSFDSDFTTATVSFTPTTAGVYYIGFHSYSEANQGYIQIDDVTVTPSLSANSPDRSALAVYPNPVDDILTITYEGALTAVEVYNLLGQRVKVQADLEAAKVEMSALPAGTYAVKIIADDKVRTVKVLKN